MDHTLALSSSKNLLKDGILNTSPLLQNTPNQTAWQNGIQTIKGAMKNAILDNRDIDMSLVSPIDSNESRNILPVRTTIQSEAGQQSSQKMH